MPTTNYSIGDSLTYTSTPTHTRGSVYESVVDEAAVAPSDQQPIVYEWATNPCLEVEIERPAPSPVFSDTPTRNCNPREEGSDTNIDPTFNNKMEEMLLASHVDVKELWKRKRYVRE